MMPPDYSDLGNARRFVAKYGKHIRYVRGIGWHMYGGGDYMDFDRRWKSIETFPTWMMTELLDEIRTEAEGTKGLGAVPHGNAMRHALRSRSEHAISAMVKLAQADTEVWAEAKDFDAEPHILNCFDGVLNLDTGELESHSPAHLVTKRAAAAYDEPDDCPMWEEHIRTVMDDDEEMIEYLHRALGYTLSGSVSEQALFIAHGVGANGKSVILNVVRMVLGDYAQQGDRNLLIRAKANDTGHNVVQLKGARLAVILETDIGSQLDEVVVKQLTGNDAVTGRQLYKNNITFVPTAKLWLATNSCPAIKSHDNGIWRRIKAVPFTVVIPPEDQVLNYDAKMFEAEGAGILRWLVRGYQKWRESGLAEPAEVRLATWEYRMTADPNRLAEFVTDKCKLATRAQIDPEVLYEAYEVWATTEKAPVLESDVLFDRLKAFGARRRRVQQELGSIDDVVRGIELAGLYN